MAKDLVQKEIKVLVAFEDVNASSRLIDFLAEHGVYARASLNAMDLKEQIWMWRPQFVFIDLMYPDFNALMLLKQLRQNDTRKKSSIKVFVASQFHNNAHNVKECLRWGASDYLVMPLKHSDVLQRIILHVQEKREITDLTEYHGDSLVQETEYFLHLTDLTLKESLKNSTLTECLHNLSAMLSMALKAVRVSIVECQLDTRTGIVLSSSDDKDINSRKLDLNKYPEIVYALNSNKILALDNLENDPAMKAIAQLNKSIQFSSMIVAPIEIRPGVQWGVFSARMAREHGRLLDIEIRFALLVSNVIALTLHKYGMASKFEKTHALKKSAS